MWGAVTKEGLRGSRSSSSKTGSELVWCEEAEGGGDWAVDSCCSLAVAAEAGQLSMSSVVLPGMCA